MERINLREIRYRVSWGSIFAGMFTVLAVSVLLSVLATSIGLFKVDPMSSDPMSGVGTTFGIWSVISLIVSLCSGGFVAGKLAGTDGLIHGFLVWAVSMIVAVILAGMLAAGAVRMTANILGSVSSVAGSVLSGAGSVVKDGVSELTGQAKELFDDIDFNGQADMGGVRQNIRQALMKSGVKEFQPDYLQDQLNTVGTDLKKSVKKLVANPQDADDIIDNFLNRLKKRTEQYARNINREDLAKAIANNSDLSRAEVEDAVDQYMNLSRQAMNKGKKALDDLQDTLREAQQEWQQAKQKALIAAEKVTNAAARSALWTFIAMLMGAVLSTVAGMFGSRTTLRRYEV